MLADKKLTDFTNLFSPYDFDKNEVSASFTLIFSLSTGVIKKLLNITRNKRQSMIKFLC